MATQLPIASVKDKILETVRSNKIVIVFGETGSGKTTQIPQYLLHSGLNGERIIGVTQPRRIAAVSMARRVAEEMHCSIGMEVGYEIRFDKCINGSTKIKYMTDGMLLNQCLTDGNLNEYGVIMIDEAHERNVDTDVLLCLVKNISKRRSDLKVIISSATMRTEKFSEYFGNAPIINFRGNMFPVQEIFQPSYTTVYIQQSVQIVRNIHAGPDNGDILVFLTGQDEIEDCCEKLEGIKNLIVYPLYGAMDYNDQQRIFDTVDPPQRKVIVATNIAETSITVEGVRFVVDCGYVKQSNFDSNLGIDRLVNVPISKAQADQRKGRAGRTNTGWCYRLYDKTRYQMFEQETKPEIYRRNLSETYLKLCTLDLDPTMFDFIDKPERSTLLNCRKELQDLDLLDTSGRITKFGRDMADFPVEPVIGKVLLSSVNYHCSMDVVTILAMLSERNVFTRGRRRRAQADASRKQFSDTNGDHFALANVFKQWENNGKSENWCRLNFINYQTMEKVDLARTQLITIMKRKGISLESLPVGADKTNIKKAFIEGFYKNICQRQSQGIYKNCANNQLVYTYPGSCVFNSSSPIMLYNEVVHTSKPFMRDIMTIESSILQSFPTQMRRINYNVSNNSYLDLNSRLSRLGFY